jgi:Lrp/AsnC family transcriptional regulator, regulator for asnA, asnC and gidA
MLHDTVPDSANSVNKFSYFRLMKVLNVRITQDLFDNLPQLDDLDRHVIAALQVDGRRSYARIASDIGASESVIRYRVQRLEKAGILQVVGIANPLRLGFDLMSLVQVSVEAGRIDEVIAAVRTFPEVSYLAATAGSYDLIVEVVCRDTAHFSELLTKRLQAVPGVRSTTSSLVLEIHKMAYGWGVGGERAPMADDLPSDTDPPAEVS